MSNTYQDEPNKLAKPTNASREWVRINITGMGIYLFFASSLWDSPEEVRLDLAAGLDSGGTPILWGLSCGVVFAACLLINIVWLLLILSRGSRGKGWRPIRAWLLVILSWFAINRLDAYSINHGSYFINRTMWSLEQKQNEQKQKEEDDSWKETVKLSHAEAEKGDKASQVQLAKCYSQGCGSVEKNKEKAYFWWSLAAENTKGAAVYERDYAERQLSSEQVSKVKERLVEWKQSHPAPTEATGKPN